MNVCNYGCNTMKISNNIILLRYKQITNMFDVRCIICKKFTVDHWKCLGCIITICMVCGLKGFMHQKDPYPHFDIEIVGVKL